LNEINGPILPEKFKLTGRPSFPIAALKTEKDLEKFISVFEWCIEEIRDAQET